MIGERENSVVNFEFGRGRVGKKIRDRTVGSSLNGRSGWGRFKKVYATFLYFKILDWSQRSDGRNYVCVLDVDSGSGYFFSYLFGFLLFIGIFLGPNF